MSPFFSIVIPTYNRAHLITRCVASLKSQIFTDFELVIVDDGSTDNTKELIEQIQDSSIRYFYQDNKGVCAARNLGIAHSSGKYICFLDSDDDVTKDWLQLFYESITNKPFDLVFCDMIMNYPDNHKKVVRALYPHKEDIYDENGLFLAGTFAVKKDFLQIVGGFDEQIKFGEFTDFGLRTRQYKPSKYFTKQVSFNYYVSGFGGGKNHKNKIASNLYLINKHVWFFEQFPFVKSLYLQNVAVSYARLSNLTEARKYFLSAYIISPYEFKILLRWLITFFPFMAKRIWN